MGHSRLLVLLCFLALLALGAAVHRDYGLAFDEPRQRESGTVTVAYLIDRLAPSLMGAASTRPTRLHEYQDRDYGVAFEVPAVVLEKLLGLADTRDIFMFRHLLTYAFCLGGAWALYSLALRRFGDRRFALLAVAFLVLSPRLFAESFYNSKDAVFMAAFAIALNTMIGFVLRPRAGSAILHALTTAFAMDVRVAAIMLPAATVAIFVVRALKREVPVRQALWIVPLYLMATVVLVVALWPWLWADPLGNFGHALDAIKNFRFDQEILFRGTLIRTTQLPWNYLALWISLTTPPFYLLLLAAGASATLWRFARNGLRLWKDEAGLQDLVFLTLLVAPLAAVVLLGSIVYDGWRQLYFVYPALLLVALRGWVVLWSGAVAARVRRPALALATAISFTVTAAWMVRAHPLQNVYFNSFAGSDHIGQFELDYWGLGMRRGLEHLLAADPAERIEVVAANFMALPKSFLILTPPQRLRLHETEDETIPHYAFTNYPATRDPHKNVAYGPNYDLFHEIKVDGEVILRIFKSKPHVPLPLGGEAR